LSGISNFSVSTSDESPDEFPDAAAEIAEIVTLEAIIIAGTQAVNTTELNNTKEIKP